MLITVLLSFFSAKKEKGVSQLTYSNNAHSVLNDTPFSEAIITQRSEEGKQKFSSNDLIDEQTDEAYNGVKENAERIPAEALKEINAHKGARYSIENDDFTGEQYVKADRQVLTGTDPLVWQKQIEQYINNVIRNDKDIIIPTSDGHFLILTERSAYKLSDRHIAKIAAKAEQYLSDEQYRLKGEIATHIDELVKLARFGKFKEDINHKHENDIGEDGFNYYTAHFMDQAGQYYRIRFSSAINKQNETVYSIGDI